MKKMSIIFNSNKSSFRRFLPFFSPVMNLFLIDSFFAIILSATSIATPFLSQYLTYAAKDSDFYSLYVGLALLISMLFINVFCNFVVTRWGHIMGVKMEVHMRHIIIDKLHRLPMMHFDNTETGSYISRIVTDLRDLPEFAHHFPEDIIIASLTTIGGFTFAFLQSPLIGYVLISVFVFGTVVIYLIKFHWRKLWVGVKKSNAELSASVGFQVEGISEIKAYNSEVFEKKRFDSFQDKYRSQYYKIYRFESWFMVSNMIIISITSNVTLAVGSYLVAKDEIDFPQLIGLTTAAVQLNKPMRKFIAVYTMFSRGSSAIDRYFEFMDFEEEKNEGKIVPKSFKGNIEFKNVNFSHRNKEGELVPVLKNFNLKIQKGQKIALVGETGIGKSTILKLLLRFYEIQKGQILIDGVDIRKFEIGALRKRLGYIQQQAIIFHDSIKNNILYGRPEATNDEVKEAAKNAQIDNFIDKLESCYETIAGPRGAKLSGGQKQRIAIARAFLCSSDILLMDEATSSLDNETEAKIKESIAKLSKDKTTIIVAHRLKTIKEVDLIIVLGKGGKILESGTHMQLIKNKSFYHNMNI